MSLSCRLDVRELDHLCPLLGFGGAEVGEPRLKPLSRKAQALLSLVANVGAR
jgi:hypothetical protein